MRTRLICTALTLAGVAAFAASAASAASVGGPAVTTSEQASTIVHQARRVVVRRGPALRAYGARPGKRVVVVGPRHHGVVVRTWRPRPHYGRIIAGIAIGTIIAATVANAVPPPPEPDLCWYWTNRARTHGYWDYCD